MINKRILKKVLSAGIILLFLGMLSIPVIGEQSTRNIQNLEKSLTHPETYNVFIYNIQGTRITQNVKTISYETAMKIKEEYQKIEQEKLGKNQEWLQKQEIFKKYDLLDIPQNVQDKWEIFIPFSRLLRDTQENQRYPEQGRFALLGLLGSVNGEFQQKTINFLNLRFAGLPLIIFGTGRCEIRLVDLLYLGQPQYLSTDSGYLYCSLFFLGQITIAPFLDPDGGLIMGISLFTLVLGGK